MIDIVLQKKKKILITSISPFCLLIVTGMKILVCYFRLEIGPRKNPYIVSENFAKDFQRADKDTWR